MSGNSYPSPPPSSSNSMDSSPQPSIRSPPAPLPPDHSDAQRSLTQASAALDAAYRRIRQVRRSLLELSSTMSTAAVANQRLSSDRGIGPTHGALLLANSPVEDPTEADEAPPAELDRPTASSPQVLLDRLRFHEAMLEAELEVELVRSEVASRSQPTMPRVITENLQSTRQNVSQDQSPNSPISPPRQHLLPRRRSLIDTQMMRTRELNPDDPSTVLGRRVAAREASGTSSPPEAPMSMQNFQTGLERELEHFRQLVRQRNSEPQRLNSVLESDPRTSRSLDVPARRSLVPPANPFPFRTAARRLPRDSRRSIQSPVSSIPSERLSLLSNLSVQNLPTPSASVTRSLLLTEEPSSYVQPSYYHPLDLRSNDLERERDDINYAINRRVAADAEEQLQNVNIDWSDEEPPWWILGRERSPLDPQQEYVLPQRPLRAPNVFSDRPFHRRTDTVQPSRQNTGGLAPDDSSSEGTRIRRRGWARLDPDGNEISTDEEEELERSRAEYRIQALNNLRAAHNQHASAEQRSLSRRGPSYNLMPTSMSPDDDNLGSFPDNLPRVRLNPRDNRTVYGSVMDSVLARTGGNNVRESPSSSSSAGSSSSAPGVPFCVDPLPMPLSGMIPSAVKKRPTRAPMICVSKDASFAGR